MPDLFDVVIRVCNSAGNTLFLYYPKAGVIEVKRNRLYAQITIAGLLEKGTQAIARSKGEPLEINLPERAAVDD